MNIYTHSKIFRVLANNKRLQILNYLHKHGATPLKEIAAYIRLSVKSTHKHLLLLTQSGFTQNERRGVDVLYQIDNAPNKIQRQLLKFINTNKQS